MNSKKDELKKHPNPKKTGAAADEGGCYWYLNYWA